MKKFTREQLQADIDFLLLRSSEAGSCDFTSARWTGMSSNALVRFAYGGKQNCMPSDRSDYHACVLTARRLPAHRKTPAVFAALMKAKAAYLKNHPEDRSSLERRAAMIRWREQQAQRDARRRRRAA